MADPWNEFAKRDFGSDTDVPLVLQLRASRSASGIYLGCAVGWLMFLGLWSFSVTVGQGQALSGAGIVLFAVSVVLIFPLTFVILKAHRYARRMLGITAPWSKSVRAVWDGAAVGAALVQFHLPEKLRYVQVVATALFVVAWLWAITRSLYGAA